MARKRSLASQLFKAARTCRDISVVASGSPRKVVRRARNKVLGRRLGRLFRW